MVWCRIPYGLYVLEIDRSAESWQDWAKRKRVEWRSLGWTLTECWKMIVFDHSTGSWQDWAKRKRVAWRSLGWTPTEYLKMMFFLPWWIAYYVIRAILHQNFPTSKSNLALEGVIFGVTLALKPMIDLVFVVLISFTIILSWELSEWVTNNWTVSLGFGAVMVANYSGTAPRGYFWLFGGLQALVGCLVSLSADFKSPLKTWPKSICNKWIISLLAGSLKLKFFECSNPIERREFRTCTFLTNGEGLILQGLKLTPFTGNEIHEGPSDPPGGIEGRGLREERTEASLRTQNADETTHSDQATPRDSRDGSTQSTIEIPVREDETVTEKSKVTETDAGPRHIQFTIKGVRGGIPMKRSPGLNTQKKILEYIARHPEAAFVKEISVCDGKYEGIGNYERLLQGDIFLCQLSDEGQELPPALWMPQLNLYGFQLKFTLRAWKPSDGVLIS